MSETGEVRVLCLHGYHGSAAVLRNQMAPLASAMPANVKFAYVDAPSLSSGDFGWWHEGFRGWERTLQWAVELFNSQPRFDGVFGFSQGAALAGLLAGVNESERQNKWFDFAVMVGGFKSDSPVHADLFRHELALPSVHIMGRSDTIVPIGDSRQLARQFLRPLVLEHSGGHVIPGISVVADPLARFFAEPTATSAGSTPTTAVEDIVNG